jgi:hypothetical protein
MEIETARFILFTTVRSREDLAAIISAIRGNCSENEFEAVSTRIATVVYDMGTEIMDYIYTLVPHLKEEYERNNEKFGRAHY